MKRLRLGVVILTALTTYSTILAIPKTEDEVNKCMAERFTIEEQNMYLGKFTITHYCDCEKCNSNTLKLAKNGEKLKENYTIAVDESVIPLNSWVEINGTKYKACDIGGAINGNRIDIFVPDHSRCLELGKMQDVDVYLID